MAADPITKNAIDELLNYDFDDDDPFADTKSKAKRDDKATLSPRGAKRAANDDDKENFGDLGLDQEVKIKKRKIPVPKLDDQRLLSEPGIPKVRKLARSGKIRKRLGLKGKGHEFSDVAKLMTYYQLWLDDLYPRAKFADGLVMVEKVGHSKRMQVMRKEWINEGKPGYLRDKSKKEEDAKHEETKAKGDAANSNAEERQDPDALFFADPNMVKEGPPAIGPEDDELDALLAEQNATPAAAKPPNGQDESEDEDDLDALLAEQDSRTKQLPAGNDRTVVADDDDDDDLEALLAEQEACRAPEPKRSRTRNTVFDEDDQDGDDLDALLAGQKARKEPELPANLNVSAAEPLAAAAPPESEVGEANADDIGNMLSSPLPNNPEETDLADLLSSPIRD